MSTKDHPNNAPGVPMKFPVWFENFQIKYINPMIRPIARYMPGVAVIKHRGRKSGTVYETVVSAYRQDKVLAILLAHGKTNWVKNVLAAGEADIHVARQGRHRDTRRFPPAGTDDPSLPRIARAGARRGVGVFVADIS